MIKIIESKYGIGDEVCFFYEDDNGTWIGYGTIIAINRTKPFYKLRDSEDGCVRVFHEDDLYEDEADALRVIM